LEASYFLAVWLYIAGLSKPDRGLPKGGYSVLLGLRLLAWLFVLLQVWRVARSRWPVEPDQPAGPGSEGLDELEVEKEVDPLAGPMAGAPDRLLVRLT